MGGAGGRSEARNERDPALTVRPPPPAHTQRHGAPARAYVCVRARPCVRTPVCLCVLARPRPAARPRAAPEAAVTWPRGAAINTPRWRPSRRPPARAASRRPRPRRAPAGGSGPAPPPGPEGTTRGRGSRPCGGAGRGAPALRTVVFRAAVFTRAGPAAGCGPARGRGLRGDSGVPPPAPGLGKRAVESGFGGKL